MLASTAVFSLLIKNQMEADVVNYTAITAAMVLSQLMKFRNKSLYCNSVFQWEEPPQRRGSSQQSKAACCSRKKQSSTILSPHLFPKGGERGRKQSISKEWQQQCKNKEANRICIGIPRLENKAEQTKEEQLDKPENSSNDRGSFRIFWRET